MPGRLSLAKKYIKIHASNQQETLKNCFWLCLWGTDWAGGTVPAPCQFTARQSHCKNWPDVPARFWTRARHVCSYQAEKGCIETKCLQYICSQLLSLKHFSYIAEIWYLNVALDPKTTSLSIEFFWIIWWRKSVSISRLFTCLPASAASEEIFQHIKSGQ